MRRSTKAFVLLEVLVSLAILGVTLAMVLRSLSTSMKASRQSYHMTVATLLARNLIDGWEVEPPEMGTSSDDFGEEYPGFFYVVEYQKVEMDYPDVSRLEEVARLAYLREISLDVYYASAADRRKGERQRILHVDTALTASERFTKESRLNNEVGFDD